jgi:IS4 transposase
VVDATTVPKAARSERSRNGVWRIHAAFDLPAERFSHFELTDQSGGECLDHIAVVKGEVRLADAAYLQPGRTGAVLAAGADVVIRLAWRNGRWLDEQGRDFDFIAAFKAARDGLIDQQVRLDRRGGTPLELRLVATRLPAEAAAVARCKAHRAAQKRGSTPSEEALIAADWVVLVTSLSQESCSAQEVLALYRLRWRIELAFKRLKSVIGLKGPPGTDERSARAFILAHLLMILLLEPLLDGFEVSPHWAQDGAQEQRARNEARAA